MTLTDWTGCGHWERHQQRHGINIRPKEKRNERRKCSKYRRKTANATRTVPLWAHCGKSALRRWNTYWRNPERFAVEKETKVAEREAQMPVDDLTAEIRAKEKALQYEMERQAALKKRLELDEQLKALKIQMTK